MAAARVQEICIKRENTATDPNEIQPGYKIRYVVDTTVNKQGLSTTQGIHGAAYGVHKNQQDRIRQQQFRTATVNVVHKVRHVTGNVAQPVTNLAQIIGNRNQNTLHLTDKGRMITNQEANQRGQIQHGSGVVQKGDKKFDKKKLIRPKGAGEHPVYMNPFGL